MNGQMPLWEFVAGCLHHDKRVMLLVVTESSGSSPGRQGFKMAVAQDGMEGSIGGGIMEVKLVELAKSLLSKDSSSSGIRKQIHRKDVSTHQSGMICSGEQTVVYFKIQPHHLESVNQIVNSLQSNKSFELSISHRDSNVSLEVKDSIRPNKLFHFEKINDLDYVFIEMFGSHHKLYIIGGGHCSLALSELMSKLDFHIHVIDDRESINTMEQNTCADKKIIIKNYEEITEVVPEGDDIYVVIMTLGYRTDLVVLKKLAARNFAYLGLLGSASKVATLMDEMKASGFMERDLKKIHAPVGIRINSHTPEEIAVSIAAEIIGVKNKG